MPPRKKKKKLALEDISYTDFILSVETYLDSVAKVICKAFDHMGKSVILNVQETQYGDYITQLEFDSNTVIISVRANGQTHLEKQYELQESENGYVVVPQEFEITTLPEPCDLYDAVIAFKNLPFFQVLEVERGLWFTDGAMLNVS